MASRFLTIQFTRQIKMLAIKENQLAFPSLGGIGSV